MKLYHGSKSGIKGDIKPCSRAACDFGIGFYMGNKEDQPMGLIATHKGHVFYELECDFEGLNVKRFGNDYTDSMDWALFVAYNRSDEIIKQNNILSRRYEAYNCAYDMIIGPIADDKMTQALQQFYAGNLCDKALIEALKYIKLGDQYVAKTDKACAKEHIKIVNDRKLTSNEIRKVTVNNINNMQILNSMFSQIQTRFRRANNVKYYDEIIEEWGR